MSDFERFTDFLRREARGYNDAPRVPAEVMWRGVEGWMGAEGDGVDEQAVDVLGYNEAPPAPRAEMWGRIEAAWALRDAAARRRRGVAGWAAALAVAASLVLGIALGRGARQSQPGEVPAGPTVATVPTETTTPPATDPQTLQPAQPAEPEPQVLAASILPIPGADADLQVAAAPNEPEPPVVRVAEDTPSEQTVVFARPPRVRRDHETTRYLGRAETLLTAFRTDQRTPASERDLAEWARELFIETRMRLDLPVSRTPEELALLNDLELVLLQMSRLGSGVPDVEWQLARESMEWKGTLPRLRAMSATDGW